jgi:hypothetical protein
MKNFHTVVLERLKDFGSDFASEPFEAGWAGEATFFLRVHEAEPAGASFKSVVQISADGIEWMDSGVEFPVIDKPGNYFVNVKHFGGWLRLKNSFSGAKVRFKLTIHLVLKE